MNVSLSEALAHLKERMSFYDFNTDVVRIKKKFLKPIVEVIEIAEAAETVDSVIDVNTHSVVIALLRKKISSLRRIIDAQKTHYRSLKGQNQELCNKLKDREQEKRKLEERIADLTAITKTLGEECGHYRERCKENLRERIIKYGPSGFDWKPLSTTTRVEQLEQRVEKLEEQTVIVPKPDLRRNAEIRSAICALDRAKKEWRDAPDGSAAENIIIGRIIRLINKLNYYANYA